MKHLSIEASKIANMLYSFLEHTVSAKVDNAPGAFMPVHLEKRHHIKGLGQVFAVAHYFKQNGDLMSDPYMEFIKGDLDGEFYPIMFEQHGGIPIHNSALAFNEDGSVKGVRLKLQKDITVFANLWFRNIKAQQFTR